MRTTLTIDDDVAAGIERLRKSCGISLEELVNEALRRGIRDLDEPARKRAPFRTRSVSLGRVHLIIDNVAEALARAEPGRFR